MNRGNGDASLQRAARVAGLAYLLIIVTSVLAIALTEMRLVVPGDVAATIDNIAANGLLYRIGVAYDMVMYPSVVVLALALYVVLRTVNRRLAQFALLCRFGEAIMGVITVLAGLVILHLLGDAGHSAGLGSGQMQGLVGMLLHVRAAGLSALSVFIGLGTIVFCYLFFRSRYIPRALSVWGMLAFLLLVVVTFIDILWSGLPSVVQTVFVVPVILFEVVIGLWLLIKGVRVQGGGIRVKAIVRDSYCPPESTRLEEVLTPVPGDTDVLVRVRAASVNAADLDYLTGRPLATRLAAGFPRPKSRFLGLDLAGEVEAVGGSVTRFSKGDEVFGDLTDHGFGAFAEYACAPESAFARKPSGLTFEQAAAVPQAGVLAAQGLRSRGGILPGQKVLINGAGGNVGVFALQIIKSFGAEVTAVDSTAKLDMLRSMGADHVIDYTKEDFTRTGQQYDRILDVAAYHPLSDCRRALGPEGVYVIVGGPLGQFFGAPLMGRLFAVTGSRKKMGMFAWKAFAEEDVAFLTELIESGELLPFIDRSYASTEVPEALRHQAGGLVKGKIVITM